MAEIPERTRTVLALTTDRSIDRRILLTADSLQAAGWEVTIVAMPRDAGVDDDKRVVRVNSEKHIPRSESLVLKIYGILRSRLAMNSLVMRQLKAFAWRFFIDQERFYKALYTRTVSQYAPDIVIANDLPMLPVAVQVADRCNAKLVYDSHELFCEQEFSRQERARWIEIETKYIARCDAIITVNRSIANELTKRYGIKNVHVIYNAERIFRQRPALLYFYEKFKLDRSAQVLLFQGGMSAGRNLAVLVRAFRHLNDPNVVLVMMGDGTYRNTLEEIVSSEGLTDRVKFHPAVSQSQLLSLTASASAGVIPYQASCLNNLFCTPNKLFEYIAAGIPIIASDLPELRKFVSDRCLGSVGDMSSPESVANLIDDFFSDELRLAKWKGQVDAARQDVCWEEEEKRLLRIIEA